MAFDARKVYNESSLCEVNTEQFLVFLVRLRVSFFNRNLREIGSSVLANENARFSVALL